MSTASFGFDTVSISGETSGELPRVFFWWRAVEDVRDLWPLVRKEIRKLSEQSFMPVWNFCNFILKARWHLLLV